MLAAFFDWAHAHVDITVVAFLALVAIPTALFALDALIVDEEE